MKATILPSFVSGEINAPASKSAMQRACAAALVKTGKTILLNFGISNDDKAALDIIQRLGAKVKFEKKYIQITSSGVQPLQHEIDCGESGLSIRMFTSIVALSRQEIKITGSGSLLKRPQSFFNEILPELNVQINSREGYLPLTIKGPLVPKNITIDGSLSSQFLTGLLFAYSAANAAAVSIKVNNLNSKPYIDLTLKVMKDFGLPVPANNNYEEFIFDGNNKGSVQTVTYPIEGDWSGAAFLLVAAAINGSLVIKGLDVFSTQADKAILQALMQAKATISIQEEKIEIKTGKLLAFQFDATDCPDLFPPLVTLASCCEGTSVIEGVHRLQFKESNRAVSLQEEFGKMGIQIKIQDDLMVVEGGKIKGGEVHSHHDHRIAMACAIAALKADGPVIIEDAEAVNKSYPQFWEHLQQIQAAVSLLNN